MSQTFCLELHPVDIRIRLFWNTVCVRQNFGRWNTLVSLSAMIIWFVFWQHKQFLNIVRKSEIAAILVFRKAAVVNKEIKLQFISSNEMEDSFQRQKYSYKVAFIAFLCKYNVSSLLPKAKICLLYTPVYIFCWLF